MERTSLHSKYPDLPELWRIAPMLDYGSPFSLDWLFDRLERGEMPWD